MTHTAHTLLVLTLVYGLAGCDRGPSPGEVEIPADVRGTVSYRESITLTPDAELTVRVIQRSDSGGPAPVVGLVRIRNPGQVPINFAVPIDAALIEPQLRYGVVASIRDADQTQFVSPQTHPVLLEGGAESIALVLERLPALADGGRPRYDCRGIGPFWHASIDGGLLRFHRLLGASVHWEFDGRYRVQGVTGNTSMVWHGLDRARPAHRLTAWITERACDTGQPYAVSITLPDVNVVRGCCRPTGPARLTGEPGRAVVSIAQTSP